MPEFWEVLDMGQLDRETLGQFTGLKDKNGKHIFEGDILSNDFGAPKMTVEFSRGAFCLEGLQPIIGHLNGVGWFDHTKMLEVIGNIYENPELLK